MSQAQVAEMQHMWSSWRDTLRPSTQLWNT